MTQAPPQQMIVKMTKKVFVLCVVTNTLPRLVDSAMRSIVLLVVTLTLCTPTLYPFLTSLNLFEHVTIFVHGGPGPEEGVMFGGKALG